MKNFFTVSLFIILLAIDQITKYLASYYIPLNTTLFSIFGGFGLTYKINKGLALHVFEQYDATIVFSIIGNIIFLPLIILYYRFYTFKYGKSKLIKLFIAFLLSALVGNSLDQLFLGYVRDFLAWPGPGTPNLADIFAFISLIFLIIELKNNTKIDLNSLLKLGSIKRDIQNLKEFTLFSKNEIKTIILYIKIKIFPK